MASQALYRKWRSQTFDELVGQEHVVRTLRNAVRAGRVGHAYLFTGPRGIGKTTVARLLAKAVNCEAAVEERPCDRCDPCRSIAEGHAVDVIEMDAASNRGIDDARDIIRTIEYRPTLLRVKVYVVDEVHQLTSEAFNALLKTLEEPPAHVLFILATTEFHKVPATIVSRCQRFVFMRHSTVEIAAHLEHVAQAESVQLEPGVADTIARSATGAMRDALSILDQLMAGGNGTVTLADVRAMLGAVESGEVVGLLTALADGDLTAALGLINQVADGGADLRQFARDLVDRLRSLMLLAATGDGSTLDLPDETLVELRALAERLEISRLLHWLKLFSNLDYQLKNSPYGQLPLELAVVELLAVPAPATEVAAQPVPRRPAGQPAPRPVAATERPSIAPARPQPALTSLPEATPPVTEHVAAPGETSPAEAVDGSSRQDGSPPEAVDKSSRQDGSPSEAATVVPDAPAHVIEVEDNAAFLLEEVQGLWPQFLDDIRAESPLVFAQMDGISPINVEEQTVVLLATKGKWQQSRLEQEKTRRLLERLLSKALRTTARIRVTMDEKEEMPDARKQIQHARNDPLVRRAINIFEAQVTGIDTP